jgi:preprotein translocase subunit SecA
VLVFFETNELLAEYEKGQVGALRSAGVAVDDIHVLNSQTADDRRNSIIRSACKPRSVTLCSREYGRGEDFITWNTNLRRAGGIHVVSTFLSLDISEEVQVQGRTARRTNPGSFSLVLSTASIWGAESESTCYCLFIAHVFF